MFLRAREEALGCEVMVRSPEILVSITRQRYFARESLCHSYWQRYSFRLDVRCCHPFPSRNGPTGLVFPRCPCSLSCISGNLRAITSNSMLSSLAVWMALSEGHSGFIVVVILVQGGGTGERFVLHACLVTSPSGT